MSDPHLPVFVYGTLQRGEERCHRWPFPPLRVDVALARGRLYDLGPYPALSDGEDWVRGELWHLQPEHLAETLRVLDQIECYGHEDVDLYVRRMIACRTMAGEELRAYAYFFAHSSELPEASRVRPDHLGHCHWRRQRVRTAPDQPAESGGR
jgi:gamma-glutamylcyclotransferase (GGCT)/AIG2-like uncharacterized protein YtfP